MKRVRICNGYRRIYEPNHPNSDKSENWNGYIYEHVMVAIDFMGRPLRENEVIHHLNGNKMDNRARNLIVLENSQHLKIHAWLDRGGMYNHYDETKINENLENTPVLYCEICELTLNGKQTKYCSNKCSSIGTTKVKDKPNKEELMKLIDENSWTAIGRIYDVSDNAVRKWAKVYGIL